MVQDLIKEGEGERLDFKQVITDKAKIAKSLVAFANTKGGTLLVGVKDNGKIKGIEPEEERQMLLWAAEHYCKPPIHLTFSEEKIDGKIVLVTNVEKSHQKPHFALGEDKKWWAYLRVKDQCLLASKVMLDVMKHETKGISAKMTFGKAEKELLQFLENEDDITIKQFCKLAKIPRQRAIRILVNLIRMDVIKVLVHEKEDYYSL